MARHRRCETWASLVLSVLSGLLAPACETTGSANDTGLTTDTPPADVPTDLPAVFSACAEPTTVTAAPQTIGETVAFINALPHPVTLDCFLQRLERPLKIAATDSTLSLQPAVGPRSPRIFLFSGALIMSVAVEGAPGNTLLEFGELVAPTKSIKGELEFPIDEVLEASAPVERVRGSVSGSKCRLCHRSEQETAEYAFAFASDALQHRAQEDVTVAALLDELTACAPESEPIRCARLQALLGHGDVQQSQFPTVLQTIYDYDE